MYFRYKLIRENVITGKRADEPVYLPRLRKDYRKNDLIVSPLPVLPGYYRVLDVEKVCERNHVAIRG